MLETLFNKIEYVIADKGEFVFPIPFLHPHNIRCYVLIGHGVKKLKIEEDFTVEKKENYRDGAIITLREAAHYAGKTLIIARIMLITQDLSLPYYSKIPSPSLERQMDKTIMICQQLREMLSRAILVPPGVNPNWEALLELLTQAAADAKDAADRAQDILDQILDIPWDEYAPLDSPHFRGVPTAPTAGKGTNTDQLATTAFVQQEIEDFLVSVKVSFTQSQWLSIEDEVKAASGEERKILEAALLEAEAGGENGKKYMFRIVTEMTDYSHVYKLVDVEKTTEGDTSEGDTAEGDTASASKVTDNALAMRKVAEIAEDGKVSSVDGNYAVECCESVEVRVMDKGYIMLLSPDAFDGYIYTLGKRLPVEYNYKRVDGGVAITGIKTNRAHWTDLTIPSSIQEGEEVLPVVEIGDSAFAGNTVITSVVIGEGCRIIRGNAFRNCSSLTKLVLPSSMRELFTSFIYDTPQLKELVLNEGLEKIHIEAFAAAHLGKLHIPASVTLIEEGGLANLFCELTVAEGNQNYKEDDGCLYSKDDTQFLRYAKRKGSTHAWDKNSEGSGAENGSKTFSVKEGAKKICRMAFQDVALDSLTFPEGVTEIGFAFFNANIKQLTLPNTLETIDINAFDCDMETITMNGSGSSGGGTGNGGGRFSLESGVLYDNTDNILYKCPTHAEALKKNGAATEAAAVEAAADNNEYTQAEFTVKESITALAGGAFRGCTMKKLDLKDVTTAGKGQGSLRGLEVDELVLGKDFETFGNNYGLRAKKITVDSSNTHFETANGQNSAGAAKAAAEIDATQNGDGKNENEDNILFTKGKTTLVYYSYINSAGTYNTPNETTALGYYAIGGNDHLTILTLTSVETIDEYAMDNLKKLTNLTMSKVKKIDQIGLYFLPITQLTFPASIETMVASSVAQCQNLNLAIFNGTNHWQMQGAFANCPKLFTIKGHKGSSAEDYANSNNLMFVDLDAAAKK